LDTEISFRGSRKEPHWKSDIANAEWCPRPTPEGCPQYGPDQCKYAVNPLLSEEVNLGTEVITYADDLELLISGKIQAELTTRVNALFERASL